MLRQRAMKKLQYDAEGRLPTFPSTQARRDPKWKVGGADGDGDGNRDGEWRWNCI